MGILSGALDLLTGGVAGGLFGLIGSLAGAWFKQKAIEAERAFKKEEWAYELQLNEQQMKARAAETEQELAIVSQEGAWQGLDSSMRQETVLIEHSPGWVNAVKSLFRPVLTLVLQGVQAWVIWLLISGNQQMVEILVNTSPTTELLRYAVYSLVFAAQTAVVWWFGDRAFAPPGMKNR